MRTFYLLIVFCFCSPLWTEAQHSVTWTVSGSVYEDGESPKPLPGASVSVKGNTAIGTITDERGVFSLDVPSNADPVLVISFIGFQTQELDISGNVKNLTVLLEPAETVLDGVEVVSTGYQELPLERATGSFVLVDNELINRRVSTTILDRLEDITPGLVFNRDGAAGGDPISIRGRSTLFANTSPLIVVDNFPYDGPVENINPNDVESISVLRDAAAASIWGARAGNGVIIITTKSGSKNIGLRVSLNSNIRISEPIDLFYEPLMAVSEVVDMGRTLFDRGFYANSENSLANVALPPLVEDLIANRDGELSDGQLTARMEAYKAFDVRSQLMEYYYRRPVYLQNSLQLSGGKDVHSYALSMGWDHTLDNIQGNKEDRLTLSFRNNWSLAGDRLEIDLGLYQTGKSRQVSTELPFTTAQPGYAYEPLSGQNGMHLPITYNLRNSFADRAPENGLLDWRFTPLDEIGMLDSRSQWRDTRINTGLGYKILDGLKAQALYQYWESASESTELHPETSYFTRNLINSYTQTDTDGSLSFPIPRGSIKDYQEGRGFSHQLRTLLAYQKNIADHEISALAGFEVKRLANTGFSTRFYGFDQEIGSSAPVDYLTRFPDYSYSFSRSTIPYVGNTERTEDRYRSWFANAGYVHKGKYQLSGSVRTDASNLFGVETNQKKVPLWSVGAGWYLHDEGFYKIAWLPYLKLRYTYGYNGNIDRTMSAYITARYFPSSTNNIISGIPLPYAQVINPPNPELRWEKIAISNWGLDFATINKRLAGTLEFYKKKGMDLIGDTPFPPSSGIRNFRGNYADTETWGYDFSLTSRNLSAALDWTTTWFISYVNEKVTKYEIDRPIRDYMLYGSGTTGIAYPMEGKPLFGIYSYPWAGLDPADGSPLGVLEGESSDDYAAILSSTDIDEITYHGSGRPLYFGSLRNNFAYKGFSLSFNISYRLNYYYRRSSVNYNAVLSGLRDHSDFGSRWQKPGDELTTSIPALPEAQNSNRELFYQNSSVLVEKGDHIRLQDITLNYRFPIGKGKQIRQLELYSYIDNLGIIWKASDDPLDPDYRTSRPPTSVAFGLRLGL